MSPELVAYLILGLVDKFGSVEAVRSHLLSKKAEGKSFDQILNELETERQEAAQAAHDAVDKMS